jgi:topoisomerase-4 subunit A
MIKRFPIDSVIRDKSYSLTKETPGSRILYLGISKSPEEHEEIAIKFADGQKLKQKTQKIVLNEFPIKSRTGSGTILTRHKIEKIEKIELSEEG